MYLVAVDPRRQHLTLQVRPEESNKMARANEITAKHGSNSGRRRTMSVDDRFASNEEGKFSLFFTSKKGE